MTYCLALHGHFFFVGGDIPTADFLTWGGGYNQWERHCSSPKNVRVIEIKLKKDLPFFRGKTTGFLGTSGLESCLKSIAHDTYPNKKVVWG